MSAINKVVMKKSKTDDARYPPTIICLMLPNILMNGPIIAPTSEITDKV